MRTKLIAMTIIAAVFAVGCSAKPEESKEYTTAQDQKPLSKEEKAILAKLKQYEFHELQYVNNKKLQSGDTNAIRNLSRNNSLWIKLYEASKNSKKTYGLKSTGFTDEGDPVTTYYLAQNGAVTKIIDYSRDMFAGVGVKEESLKRFFIGYTGYNLPCPCGSGKTWLKCNPGQCRCPTFVIVTEKFPEDEELHWIPPPADNEKSWTWQFSPNKAELSSAVDKTTLVATAKKYALQDPRTADLRAKYPDILDQPATLLLATQDSKYHVVRFRRENPRGAAQFLEVQINLDMTLRGFKEYKQGY